jgi:AraC-like DNA-binding protein
MDSSSLQLLHNSLEHIPNPHICMLQLGWEKCHPGYSYTNYRDLFLVHFIHSGEGTLSIHGHTYSLQANDIFLIRPGEKAVYTASQENPWHYYYFAFNGVFAPELVQRTAFRDNHCWFSMKDGQLADMIIEATIGMESSRAADLYALQQFFRFMALIVDDSGLYEPHMSQAQQYVAQAQHYIQIQYAQPIRVADIAKRLNINRSHFYRIFRECTGISPEEYIVDYRLQQAKKLMSETQYPISYISQSVGFNSYSNFYTMFARINACSPNAYRQQQNYIDINEDSGFFQSSFPIKEHSH